jgi:hypothetical protein
LLEIADRHRMEVFDRNTGRNLENRGLAADGGSWLRL